MSKSKLLGNEKKKQLKEQKKSAKQKNKKQRRSVIRWAKDLLSEMKKVTWPTRKELINYTIAVLVFVLVFGAITGLFDFVLGSLFTFVLSK